MNALLKPTLTDSERARIRGELFKEKLKDYPFILEALGGANSSLAELIKISLANGDSFVLLRAMQESVKLYIESELAEDAERELLGSKDVNGPRYLEA
jgi:hypothetical protein